MGDRLRPGTPSRYVTSASEVTTLWRYTNLFIIIIIIIIIITSQLGQLSLASLRGREIEYQLRLGQWRESHLCRVVGNTV